MINVFIAKLIINTFLCFTAIGAAEIIWRLQEKNKKTS